ncbi:E3 ubiquitin-protein ligase RNF8 isoform X3 [Rhinatrema bivittatum]|uniref:E3 ubiquitin-protein ligase RNF8 isoform X3 n=1 Tax=Rhinatrema bivittatum TaxID=194408 RepID=UPI001125C25C|nr:E3 ubiquitin-protein ligase RNF8 isoform X3 [Rhinatrema bivittatum]
MKISEYASGKKWFSKELHGLKTEVTIGRGFGLTYQLVSKLCPLMISRYHCIFKQSAEDQWTVTDNKSLNGVWLNQERLDPLKAYPVRAGDYIQLGVPLQDSEKAEYEYELIHEELEVIRPFLSEQSSSTLKGPRTKRKFSLEDSDASGAEGPSYSKSKVHRLSLDSEQASKSSGRAQVAKEPTERMDPKLSSAGPSRERRALSEKCTQDCSKVAPDEELLSETQSRSTMELSKVRETMLEIKRLNLQVQEKQMELLSARQQIRKSAQLMAMEQELQELQEQLQVEQEEQLLRVKQLERTFHEEEEQEGGRRPDGEENLKEQLAQALQEHTHLMEELNRSKKDFEQIIKAKNKELQETKEEREKVRAQKEEFLSQMNDVLENELQCIICSEHFIEAVTLNCAHSFCSYCIKEWIKRKAECPICRQDIVSQTRSLVLDNCIDRMVENLSLEMKQRRDALIQERKEQMKAVVNLTKSDSEDSIMSIISSILSISSFDSDDFEDSSEEDSADDSSYYLI